MFSVLYNFIKGELDFPIKEGIRSYFIGVFDSEESAVTELTKVIKTYQSGFVKLEFRRIAYPQKILVIELSHEIISRKTHEKTHEMHDYGIFLYDYPTGKLLTIEIDGDDGHLNHQNLMIIHHLMKLAQEGATIKKEKSLFKRIIKSIFRR
ncbi:MAG: hypothetical protein PHG83_03200 [Patescibacteria group bacterium]|nr:hypothetical protein [Patescibacteria group bacterium]